MTDEEIRTNLFKLGFSVMTPELEQLEIKKEQEAIRLQKEKEEVSRLTYFKTESGVNKRWWNVSLNDYKTDTPETERNYKTVKSYIENPSNTILFLCGNNGTGKTHLATSIIRELRGKYTTSLRLCIEYECGSDFKSDRTKLQILDSYARQPMLVIDEIGRTTKEQIEKEVLMYLINERYENLLPTVLITNMDKKSFCNYVSPAVYDRMRETAISLEFTEKSRRLDKRAINF